MRVLRLLSHIRESSHGSQSALACGQEGHMAEWAEERLEGNTQTLAAVKASHVNTHSIHTHLLSSQPFRFSMYPSVPFTSNDLGSGLQGAQKCPQVQHLCRVSADAEGTSNNLVNSILTMQLNRHFQSE